MFISETSESRREQPPRPLPCLHSPPSPAPLWFPSEHLRAQHAHCPRSELGNQRGAMPRGHPGPEKRESPNYLFPSCHPPLLPGASCGLFLSRGGGVTRTPPSYGSASVCLSRLSQFVPRRERGGDEIRKVEVWVWRAGERPSGGEGAGGGVFMMFSPPIASYARQWYPWDGFTRSICP